MAHELTFRDGAAEMFSVAKPAWHREGVVLDNPPNLDEALTIAGLRFDVEKRNTFRARSVKRSNMAVSPCRLLESLF